MIEPLIILILGLTPFALSLWLRRQSEARAQARLRLAMDSVSAGQRYRLGQVPSQSHPDDRAPVLGVVIRDSHCRYNARSPYIRCAVNPSGPCCDCSSYQPRL
ncbi:MAG: hypothetical protein KME20_17060 [Kaiparowitsia implicata GSE-PSE-MK54-09C]|nr:hypothetical protein [Kaiparowitsia implicata GSE-PSE-MK54-09C]